MNPDNSKIQLVIFDWAGTTIDFGSCAPATAFRKVFAAHGVDVTDREARAPMGMNKREHLVTMLSTAEIGAAWAKATGHAWTEADVDTLYEEFAPLQLQAITETSELVPNVMDVIDQLRSRRIKIGGTTGYFRAAADSVMHYAKAAGFAPDANACADDVPQGRPAPWMIYRIMEQLNVFPPASVVKVGDTVADVQAGCSSGCWSIGVCDSSSLMGLSYSEFAALSDQERLERIQDTAQTFLAAGCHAVISSISELPELLDEINLLQDPTPRVLKSQKV